MTRFDEIVRPLREEAHEEWLRENASRYILGRPGTRFAITVGGSIPRMTRRPAGGVRIARRWIFWWAA